MKISIDNGAVVCSLEDKNREFLSACAGLFDGFLNGKLKMRWENPEEWYEPDGAIEFNALRLKNILINANMHGIEVDSEVHAFYSELQAKVAAIKARERAEEENRKAQEKWQYLCRDGCGGCKQLTYDIDLPICKETGEILKDKPVPKDIGGVRYLFNMEAFPSEDCPFNINKKQGEQNERNQQQSRALREGTFCT